MRGLRVVVIGGGPAGLFLARLLRLWDPTASVQVHERHDPDATPGFGIVLSDRAMVAVREADAETHELIVSSGGEWSDVELRLPGESVRYSGYGFVAVARDTVTGLLLRQARAVGVRVCHGSEARIEDFPDADVVVVADGARSRNRTTWAGRFGTTVEKGLARYIWFGTTAGFDALTHVFTTTEHGAFAGHAHPYGKSMSSFVVQTDEATWRAAGMDLAAAGLDRGETDEYARKTLSTMFADQLNGHDLVGNESQWRSFAVVSNERWSSGNVVLIGDAAHTAHFSVGSGTKMAMDDAVVLAEALCYQSTVETAFQQYEEIRRGSVERTQRWGERSMRWWETFANRADLPPRTQALHFITRTGSLSYEGMRARHHERIDEVESDFGAEPGQAAGVPFRLGPVWLPNRVVIPLRGTVEDQVREAWAGGVSGGGLVLADLRVAPMSPRWSEAVAGTARFDCVFGAVVSAAGVAAGMAGHAIGLGARVIEVLLGKGDHHSAVTSLVGDDVAVCAGLRCPSADAWSPAADVVLDQSRLLRDSGVDALHLHGPWEWVRDYADRVRTETGLPVIADGPDGWSRAAPATGAVDDDATLLHLALLSGRLDLVAAWPVVRPTVVREFEPGGPTY